MTVVGVVCSFLTSDLAIKAGLDKKNRNWLKISTVLNTVNVITFLGGVLFVGLYAMYNA